MKERFITYLDEILAVTALAALFILASYFSQTYETFLIKTVEGYSILGMFIYVFGAAVATIVPTLIFLPLLPVAVTLWGSFLAAVLSVTAWILGASVAFLIARRFGHPLVLRFIGEEKIGKITKLLPEHHLFWGVVFLRIIFPVDLVSYALGALNLMRFLPYIMATFVGIAPFAFAFAYLADASVRAQSIALSIGALLFVFAAPFLNKRYHEIFGKRK